MRIRLSMLFLLSLLASCAEREQPSFTHSQRASDAEPGDAERVRRELARVQARFAEEISPPSGRGPDRCPDELGFSRTRPVETLVLRTRDHRRETRTPLPLDFLSALSSDDFASITSHLVGGAEALWNPAVARPHTPEDAPLVLAAISALFERRYLAELRVESFAEPRLFRRKDALRPEWEPGFVAGRLVVFDLAERRALCQAPLSVRGSANGLETRRSQREATRKKLQLALVERVHTALEGALGSISVRLVLPARLPVPEPQREVDPQARFASR